MEVKKQPTMVIAVMGVTGSGKSTFVRTVTGKDEVVVGHSLEACTQEITAWGFSARGHNILLADTPGFNDTYKSETEILHDIAKWLETLYRQNAKLVGILYLHRITDNRMEGSAMRNLKIFRKLCGKDPMKSVVILSTCWGKIDHERAVEHEDELKANPNFWGSMIEHGARVRRFDGTKQSALDVLMLFAGKAEITLDIQRELVDEGKSLGQTAAGSAVNEELHRLEAKYSEELKRIRAETAEALAEKDAQYENILKAERTKMEEKMHRIHSDQETLRQERREEVLRIVADNHRNMSQLQKEGGGRRDPERHQLGSKFVQLIASGTAVAVTPLAIPVAVASLANFLSSASKAVLDKKGYKKDNGV
ncbi:hypothetical protein H9Q74_006072 [Fusarium xylarioides]|nr:hypothetical protein H9Q71_004927 [Fusarium xylarioides]KAG5823843.1 hypothetical protein H9Q74_006072 [Fusarium xylarioides]